MTTERNKRIILSLRMEWNYASPAFRADVLTTVLERNVDHSFRSKGNTSNITLPPLPRGSRVVPLGGVLYVASRTVHQIVRSFVSFLLFILQKNQKKN